MSTEIIISNDGGVYFITVNGRATFEHASQLRNLAKSLESVVFSKICLDLANCGGMDSTFMGILAMLGLRAKKINAPMCVYNAGEANLALVQGLGLKKLFVFCDGDMGGTSGKGWSAGEDGAGRAETVLEAHQTLMTADEQNVKKFEKVVELVQKDLDKMNREKN